MKSILYCFLIILLISGCKKLIDVGSPKNQLTTDKVFADTSSATAAIGNIYAQLDKTVESNLSINLDLYSDNLNYTGSTQQDLEYLRSSVSSNNTSDLTLWQNLYFVIYQCNDLIGQLSKSRNIPANFSGHLTGEARFLRAYAYFLLANIYGNVPVLLTTDVNVNSKASQANSQAVYQQVINDLITAGKELPNGYTGGGRVRANTWSAMALLAKVYLFQNNWTQAEIQASAVINSGLYTPLTSCANTFLANSSETILQIWNQDGFTTSAVFTVPQSPADLPLYPVTSSLINSFEPGDLRNTNWIGTSTVSGISGTSTYFYFNKYKNRMANSSNPEYLTLLRIADTYLVRAEARANLGKVLGAGGAEEDVNTIRARAGLSNTLANNKADMLKAIAQERRVELFGEWGNRFFDLKRTGNLDKVIGVQKTTWLSSGQLLPIPLNELTYDSHMIQNPGYH
ncbi:RagB/SusD family nutrient uptake outer membrane protein [Mucilaginibacter flavus]|uniref:RagB/SusD family nutrient uptake outer membrane protein n=1 Tax=Mucilaginibacter flavus TaxID=931504 RepID=UPI0025B518FF|nr:RagB/SusD family nutrient uptake outer membrane protein [Mucilaginibacter flavus]MDN3584561.1 RagB/SusD family nutrient uptake outer membrane protein [Mucilaginibacter flavus]